MARLGRWRRGLILCGALGLSIGIGNPGGAATQTPLERGLATTSLTAHELHQLANINVERVDPWCWKVNGVCWHSPATAKKPAIMFGDSHVAMWLPAVAAALPDYQIQVWWHPSCPVAKVKPFSQSDQSYNTECVKWRSDTIAQIVKVHPRLIILAERTSSLFVSSGQLITTQALTSALQQSFAALAKSHAQIALIGDTPSFPSDPVSCLALHRTTPLYCAIKRDSLAREQQSLTEAEKAAAKESGVTFVDPRPWVCSKTLCPALLGNDVGYSDQDHFTASAVAQLSGRLKEALQPALR